jgi:hypothetical protein
MLSPVEFENSKSGSNKASRKLGAIQSLEP